jgi:hypothetical protein
MKKEKVYPKGIMAFKPNEKAPNFVKASVLVTPNELISWLKENSDYLTDYKGNKQLKLQLLENEKGLYFVVDTYQPTKQTSDLPF